MTLNGARVFLNGQEVIPNESWEVPSGANVTSALRPGANEIRVEARNEGGSAGFVARLRVRTEAGETIVLETDATWEVRKRGAEMARLLCNFGGFDRVHP